LSESACTCFFPATAPWDAKSPLPAIATQAATASEI
jgi:hypothetical protein